MKKCSTFLDIKETQIKTTLRFYLTLVEMAIIKGNKNKQQCWQGCDEAGTLYTAGGNASLYNHYGKHMAILQKLKIELPFDPVIPHIRHNTIESPRN
jgi:hypothetical protein